MGDLLHLEWAQNADAPGSLLALIKSAETADYRSIAAGAGFWTGVSGPRPPKRRRLADGRLTVFGDLFETSGTSGAGPWTTGDDVDLFRALTRRFWGRYVAFAHGGDGRVRSVFRDPSGAMELLSWTSRMGVRIQSSALPDWLVQQAPPQARLNWDRITGMLAHPTTIMGDGAFDGLTMVVPGEMAETGSGARTVIWRPAEFVGASCRDPGLAREALRTRMDEVLRAWSHVLERPGVELSGGLDSAIVAGSAVSAGLKSRLWLNMFGPGHEADERPYARAIADRLDVELSAVERGRYSLAQVILAETSGGPRPGLNGRDYAFDIDVSRQCHAAGLDSLLTGKGGDALFFQMGVPEIFVDLWRDRGPAAAFSPNLPDLARWTRRSVWSLLVQALRHPRSGGPARRPPAASFLTKDRLAAGDPAKDHPWMRGLDGIGPAKRLQVEAVTAALAFNSEGRRRHAVDLIHPILSQPVVEWCLGLPIDLLTAGGRDRALARDAFVDRLPTEIRNRSSKGDLTAFLGRQIVADLPFLRDHLLDGRLVQQGVIDRTRLEAALDRDRIQWQGGFAELSLAAVIESWVRHWEARLV